MVSATDFISSQLGIPLWLFGVMVVWTIIWKGFALWKSARLRQPIWFVALLIVNTLGILEILYLFVFSRLSGRKNNPRRRK